MKQQKRAEATRKRILDAAEALFARQGFDGTSIRQIVRDADISIQTLHYHFINKLSLYHAVLERSILPLMTMIDGHVKEMLAHDISDDAILHTYLGRIIDELFDIFHAAPNYPLLFFRQWLEQDRDLMLVELEQLIPTLLEWSEVGRQLEGGRGKERADLRLLLLNFTWIYTGLFVNSNFIGELIGIAQSDPAYLPHLKQHAKLVTRRLLGRNAH